MMRTSLRGHLSRVSFRLRGPEVDYVTQLTVTTELHYRERKGLDPPLETACLTIRAPNLLQPYLHSGRNLDSLLCFPPMLSDKLFVPGEKVDLRPISAVPCSKMFQSGTVADEYDACKKKKKPRDPRGKASVIASLFCSLFLQFRRRLPLCNLPQIHGRELSERSANLALTKPIGDIARCSHLTGDLAIVASSLLYRILFPELFESAVDTLHDNYRRYGARDLVIEGPPDVRKCTI